MKQELKMPKSNATGRRARTSLWAMAMFGSMAGILLYSKLKLTTALPRSAYAVPEADEGTTPNEAPTSGAGEASVEREDATDADDGAGDESSGG